MEMELLGSSGQHAERLRRAIRKVMASRRRLSRVADEIGRMIVSDELPVGQTLSERMFGTSRAVSRTSFREAIKLLEGKGLVSSRQYTGTQVAPRQAWHLMDPDVLAWRIETGDIDAFIHDFFEFRRSVEPAAAESAARHGNAARVAEIRSAYQDMADLELSDPFGDRYVDADVRFHRSLFTASGNEFLFAMGYVLEAPMILSFTLTASLRVGPSNRVMLHDDVVRCIEARDPPGARKASLALLSDVAHDVQRVLDSSDDPIGRPSLITAEGGTSK